VTAEIRLVPTPGHTPGHVSVAIESEARRAVITGDVLHHPIQCALPELATRFDHDVVAAEQMRRACIARWADPDLVVIGTHWAAPSASRIVRDGGSYRVEPLRA
jgi:glyoxylase-like metal-dependent hydrolase (beta-lactamase superfamily II)